MASSWNGSNTLSISVSGYLMICPGPTTLKQFAPRPGACLASSIVFSHPIVMPTLFCLYIRHVLPILDYASVVWDPHLKKDQQLLDSVQHFALKIASRSWNSSSATLHNQYKITPLINRRHYFKLLVTFKFLNGFLYFPGGFFYL